MRPSTEWITQMKGLTMMTIIVFHWFWHHLTGVWQKAANAGAQGNHIFFILSAFGLYLSLSNKKSKFSTRAEWKVWFLKRSKKILISYYISVIIIFSAIALYGYLTHQYAETLSRMGLNTGTALSTLLLYRNFIGSHSTAINTPWWFSITILQLYLLFPVLAWILDKLGWKVLAVCAFVVNLMYIFGYAVLFKSSNNAFICFPLQWLFSFSLGLVLCDFYIKNQDSFFRGLIGWRPILMGLLLEGVGVYLATKGETGKAFNDLVFGLGIFLLIFNLIRLCSRFKLASQVNQVVGEHSLILFLLHAPFIYLLFPAQLPPGLMNGFVYFLAYVIFLVVLTWLVSNLIFNKLSIFRGVYESQR